MTKIKNLLTTNHTNDTNLYSDILYHFMTKLSLYDMGIRKNYKQQVREVRGKNFILILLLTLFITSTAGAQINLDIDSAVIRALESNLSLERTRVDIEAARRRSSNSWNGLIPSVGASALVSHPTSITDSIPFAMDTLTPGFTLSASMNINPAIFANMNQTKQEYEAGLINYSAARQELEFQVRRLYYQILLLKANAELAEQNIVSAQNRYEQTLALQRAGRASNLDELTARLDVQTQRTNAQNAKASYNNAIDILKHLLIIPMEETVVLQGDLQMFIVDDIDTTGNVSSESMQMNALRQSIAVTEAQLRTAQLRTYLPSLVLSWNSTPLYPHIAPLGERNWMDSGQFSIALSFKMDNYLPWSGAKEQINSLNDAITKQQSNLTEAAINHQNSIQKLLRDIERSAETIETLRLNITLAEETLRMYEESFRSGGVELQTLNNTRDNIRTVQNRFLSEQYNLLSVILELEKELNIPFGSFQR